MADQKTFLSEVTKHIKMKEAKKLVTAELAGHIEAGKQEWIRQGLTEEEAEEKAVREMGSPHSIGEKFNKIYRPQVDWITLVLLAAVLGFGFLPLISIGALSSRDYIMSKSISVLIGASIAIVLMYADYRKWAKFRWHFYIAGLVLLCLMSNLFPDHSLFPEFFPKVKGVTYIYLGGTFIFSNLFTLSLFYLGWAGILQKSDLKLWEFLLLFTIPGFIFYKTGIPTCMLYMVMVFSMLFQSRVKKRAEIIVISSCMLIISGVTLAITFLKNQELLDRFNGFINPDIYKHSSGYIYVEIKKVLSNAEWLGSNMERVPLAHTDYAFLSIIRSFGYLPAFLVALALILLLIRIFQLISSVKDPFGRTLITGGCFLYSVQVLYSIAMSLGLLPSISVSLPFISYGFTPLVMNAVLVGAALSIYRRKNLSFI
ncbi:FtsW/RodA/SpoVE family cell cycle protein [Bacillus sp. FJAT-42376]|uniref:FtsW/RodA/SpoVE family cell cycle protein n=1 Tax=Bacillus sp. FJAT-42376 TaxID=2014076 RepID=UPI000F4F2B94|nr:FtsW/RodA/SpoVE family cell cycle protein [Bacillus sp. FJAT-42376]AZB41931.1 FtsW/RodA/SpoVE family cell cycle protein [Bacillus sp. FJAT-42376]